MPDIRIITRSKMTGLEPASRPETMYDGLVAAEREHADPITWVELGDGAAKGRTNGATMTPLRVVVADVSALDPGEVLALADWVVGNIA